jgi:hypothetical protein
MNFLKMFMKNHMRSPDDTSSVAGCNGILRREEINEDQRKGKSSSRPVYQAQPRYHFPLGLAGETPYQVFPDWSGEMVLESIHDQRAFNRHNSRGQLWIEISRRW